MDEATPKWRRAKIKFLTKQHHNLRDYGNSTRGCDTICPGEVRNVVFESWDDGFVSHNKNLKVAHIELHDLVLMTDQDFEIIELGEPQNQHPQEVYSEMWKEEEKRRQHRAKEKMFSRSLMKV
jgi:hypothetical protein